MPSYASAWPETDSASAGLPIEGRHLAYKKGGDFSSPPVGRRRSSADQDRQDVLWTSGGEARFELAASREKKDRCSIRLYVDRAGLKRTLQGKEKFPPSLGVNRQ